MFGRYKFIPLCKYIVYRKETPDNTPNSELNTQTVKLTMAQQPPPPPPPIRQAVDGWEDAVQMKSQADMRIVEIYSNLQNIPMTMDTYNLVNFGMCTKKTRYHLRYTSQIKPFKV